MTLAQEKNTESEPATPEPEEEKPVFLMSLEDVRRDPRRAGRLFAEHFGLTNPKDDVAPS